MANNCFLPSLSPFRSRQFGPLAVGGSYCAYLSRMEKNSGKNRKFEVFFLVILDCSSLI